MIASACELTALYEGAFGFEGPATFRPKDCATQPNQPTHDRFTSYVACRRASCSSNSRFRRSHSSSPMETATLLSVHFGRVHDLRGRGVSRVEGVGRRHILSRHEEGGRRSTERNTISSDRLRRQRRFFVQRSSPSENIATGRRLSETIGCSSNPRYPGDDKTLARPLAVLRGSNLVMKQERHPPYVSTTLPYHERVPFAFLLLVPSTRSRFRIDIYR